MSKDDLEFYERRFDLFAQQGWTDLVEDFEQLKQNLSDLAQISTEQDLWYRKGQIEMINYLLQLKTLTEQAYEEANAYHALADTWTYYEAALSSTSYMPPSIIAMLLTAYTLAKANYLAAWDAMEQCLNNIA